MGEYVEYAKAILEQYCSNIECCRDFNKEGMGGGGVKLYVRDTFSVEVLASSDPLIDNTLEFIICKY